MEVNINTSSADAKEMLSTNPTALEFFAAVRLMRDGKLETVSQYLTLANGAMTARNYVNGNIGCCRDDVRKLFRNVTECYESYLELGRVYPYATYLQLIKKHAPMTRTSMTSHDEKELSAAKITMSKLKFDSKEEIIESATVVYVILAGMLGWEKPVEVAPTQHYPQ